MASPYLAEMAELKARLADSVAEGVPNAEANGERGAVEQRLGSLYARVGENDQALVHLTNARRLLEAKNDKRAVGRVDALIGATCAVKGEHERATAYFDRARETADRLGDHDLAARVANNMADAALARGDVDVACGLWEGARKHFEKYWDGSELSRVYAGLAVQHAVRGELDDADRLSEKALEDAEAAGDPLWLGRALLARAEVRSRAKDLRGAKRFFRRGISVLQDHELRRDLAEAYLAYGFFVGEAADALPDGFTDPPAFWLAKAQALFRELGSLGDMERVREAFRRHGRRATDKIAEVEVLQLLQELKQNRIEVQRDTQRLADHALASFDQIAGHAPRELQPEIEQARLGVTRAERAMARGVDQMALAEEKFLGALNTVILERENIRTLLELCRSLNEIRDYARLPPDIAKMAAQLTGADRALVALIEHDGKLVLKGGVRIQDEDAGVWRPAAEAVVGKNGSPRLLPARPPPQTPSSQTQSPQARDMSSRAAEQAVKNEKLSLGVAMVCPLRHGEKVFGAIYCDKELCGGVFAERDLDLLAIFAAQVATILENSRFAEELRLAARTRAATLEAISDGVFSFSASGAVTSINAAATRMLGVSGTAERELRLASFPDLAFLGGLIARGEEADGRVVRLASGDHLLNARCVRDDGGAVAGLVVTLTEMKRATSLAQKIVGSTARFTFGDIIGSAPLLRRRLQLAEAAARTDSSVLVTGESGTGKELLAQAIHNAGLRASGPFVGINCAAIPRELLESELFGYDAGAFTGAKRGGHPGKFELAEGGTILLDEIGDMPLEMQAKLLRVLQEKRVQRLGALKELPLDTRVIATTNRDLAEECDRGRFRQDLFFRLRVIHIELPPLRARREDIPMLVEHFLQLFSARLAKQVRGVTPEILNVLLEYPWPGNVRELEHVLEGEVNLAADGQELLHEIPVMIESAGTRRRTLAIGSSEHGAAHGSVGDGLSAGGGGGGGVLSIAQSEKQLLLAALAAHHGSVPDVARALGVSRGTVYNKMKKFQIDPDSYRNE